MVILPPATNTPASWLPWEKAAEHYARFVDLWKDADPELQPRVEAAQRRIDLLFA